MDFEQFDDGVRDQCEIYNSKSSLSLLDLALLTTTKSIGTFINDNTLSRFDHSFPSSKHLPSTTTRKFFFLFFGTFFASYILNQLEACGRLLALGLNLPEDALVNIHGYNAVGETYRQLLRSLLIESDIPL